MDGTIIFEVCTVHTPDIPMYKSVSLRDPSRSLTWSNPDISDEVLIRKALITGRFSFILQACLEFGLDAVRAQWSVVVQDPELTNPVIRALVGDILDNIARGFAQAAD